MVVLRKDPRTPEQIAKAVKLKAFKNKYRQIKSKSEITPAMRNAMREEILDDLIAEKLNLTD